MTILTLAMLVALQDVPFVHDDPRARTGPVLPRTPVQSSTIHQPRGRVAVAPSRGPGGIVKQPGLAPGGKRAGEGKADAGDRPANGPPRGRVAKSRRPQVRVPPAVIPGPAPVPPVAIPVMPPPRALGAAVPRVATPIGSSSIWVRNGDYPMAMMRAHATGITVFAVDVDAKGGVADCRITGSSGWPALDDITCSLVRSRGRFDPARNRAGEAIKGQWTSRFRWELPDIPVAFGSWARVVRFVVDAQGGVKSCTVSTFGTVPVRAGDPCRTDAWRMKLAHGGGPGLATVTFAEVHRVEGMPLPAGFTLPQGRRLFERSIDFEVRPLGTIGPCTVKAMRGENILPADYSAYDCHTGLRYIVPPALQQQGERKASFSVELVTAPSPQPEKK